jgi:hypothetical protein
MLTHALALCLLSAAPADKTIKPLPTLAKELKVDGDLKDFTPATDFKMPEAAHQGSAQLAVKAAFRKDTLFVAVTVTDDKVIPGDELSVSIYFPDSGMTSRGLVYTFGAEGVRPAGKDSGVQAWEQALVQAGVKLTQTGATYELAFPARALPRFQGTKPLALSICAEYVDLDMEGGETTRLTTCPTAEMVGGPTRLPDEFRKNLKLSPPADVEGIEAREKGWVGFSKLHYPTWAEADQDFTQRSLRDLVSGDAVVDPASVQLNIPEELRLPDNRPIFTFVTGKNPYVKDGCKTEHELRMAMYVVKGPVASRVLEWPAATCSLGRALKVELSNEGTLAIGYTNGTTAHFVWGDEHFERSELGAR